MILKDMLNRIDDNTDVEIFNSGGGKIHDYLLNDEHMNSEIIFPISVNDNKIEIWIDTEVA